MSLKINAQPVTVEQEAAWRRCVQGRGEKDRTTVS